MSPPPVLFACQRHTHTHRHTAATLTIQLRETFGLCRCLGAVCANITRVTLYSSGVPWCRRGSRRIHGAFEGARAARIVFLAAFVFYNDSNIELCVADCWIDPERLSLDVIIDPQQQEQQQHSIWLDFQRGGRDFIFCFIVYRVTFSRFPVIKGLDPPPSLSLFVS